MSGLELVGRYNQLNREKGKLLQSMPFGDQARSDWEVKLQSMSAELRRLEKATVKVDKE